MRPAKPLKLRIAILVAALALSQGFAWADDVDPNQVVLKEAYQSIDPPFLVIRVESRPDAADLPVRWRHARESYFVSHPHRPAALRQLSQLDGPLDLERSADGVRTRDRVREWIGPPWQESSLATDYLVLRSSASEGTHFTPQVFVFSQSAQILDAFFSGRMNSSPLQPKFLLTEMSETAKTGFWQSVLAGDYALELLPDPRRILHTFEFETEDHQTARLIVDEPRPTDGRLGTRIRVETQNSVKTYEVDTISADGRDFYTERCGVLRGERDYGALLQVQKDGTAKWHVDRFADPIILGPDQSPLVVDSDGLTSVYALDAETLDTPLIQHPIAREVVRKPGPAFIAYANADGLLFLNFSAAESPERELLTPLNSAAWYLLGTRQELMQVFQGGSHGNYSGWDDFTVEATFRMPARGKPDQVLRAQWDPKQMNWQLAGRTASLVRLSPEEETALVDDVKRGKLVVSTISRNYRTPLALARTYGAKPTYFYWDTSANGTLDYRFFLGTPGQMSLIDDDTIGEYQHIRDGGTLALDTDDGLRVFLHTPRGAPLFPAHKWFELPASKFESGGSYLRLTDEGALKRLAVQRRPSAKQVARLVLTPAQLGILETPPSPCAAILRAMGH